MVLRVSSSVSQPMSTHAESPQVRAIPRFPARYLGGVVTLAIAYYASAKLGQALRYTGSVSAVWPPVGLGIASLYLWGVGWWPGVFLGDLVVNFELYVQGSVPAGSLIGQQAGNIAEIIGGALLLRRLIGSDARFDRAVQVGGMFVAVAAATAVSATVGTISMLGGGVIDHSEVPTFWRTWWLGDLSGALVILPLIVVWARDLRSACRTLCTWSGALMIASVTLLAFVAVSTTATVTYLVFPALIWAAYRFRAPGATLAVAIMAGVTIGMTADNLGAFSNQQIDNRTLSTQLYIAVAAMTTLLLSAIVSERERSLTDLEESKRREGDRAVEERYRIARELHDSVSQALFSAVLQIRTAQKVLRTSANDAPLIARSLETIASLTRGAQREMRELIFELRRDTVEGGLVRSLRRHADQLGTTSGFKIEVQGPVEPLPLAHATQEQLFAIVRESLANVVKHSGVERAEVRIRVHPGGVLIDVNDAGRGFEPTTQHPGHYGLESIRDRAAEIGGTVTITSRRGVGTAVHVEVPVAPEAQALSART
jgi:signal transduction histidine kinase